MRRSSAIPAMFTLGNLICGLGSLWFAAKAIGLKGGADIAGFGQQPADALAISAWLIFIAMIFDVLDGKIARLTGTTSHFGKELDSLADMISFGVAPALLVEALSFNDAALYIIGERARMMLCAGYAVFAALRLARYNVGTGKKTGEPTMFFTGLPTPAAAGLIAGAILVQTSLPSDFWARQIMHFAPLSAFVIGLLMVSRVPFPHLGNKLLSGRLTLSRMVVVALVVFALVAYPGYLLLSVFAAYALVSIVLGLFVWLGHPRASRESAEKNEHDE
ncbi:MAG: CDP-diacylglycerol--serine O-phosphatidyltransferase [Candidatus Brocadiia bacterium]